MSLSCALDRFKANHKDPWAFLQPRPDGISSIVSCVKDVFDFGKVNQSSAIRSGPLSRLLVEGYDEEGVWEQLQMQNKQLFPCLKRGFGAQERLATTANVHAQEDRTASESEVTTDCESAEESNDGSRDSSPSPLSVTRNKKGNRSKVDDRFFKLEDMEAFLAQEDKREERRRDGEDDSNDEVDEGGEEVDIFTNLCRESEDEDDWDEMMEATSAAVGKSDTRTKRKKTTELMYSDFFDPPEEESKPSKSKRKTDKREMSSSDEDEEEDEEEEEGEEDEDGMMVDELDSDSDASIVDSDNLAELESSGESEDDSQPLSAHEKRQWKLKQQIADLEAENLAPKMWQMSGEAAAPTRPANSLLEEDLEMEHAAQPAPEITEELSKRIEDIIKQRIKDQAWDDVERKQKPVEKPYEFRKEIPLDQEKSKLSLAEVYEKEYLKEKQKDAKEEEKAEYKEIRQLMQKFFTKLDALSNFHYTPKPPVPELSIVTNAPAITLEEVVPSATTDTTLLAPEEVAAPAVRPVKGKTERDSTDLKRERRSKKAKQRHRAKVRAAREKLIEKTNPGLGNKHSKQALARKLAKDEKLGKLALTKEDKGVDKALRSSSAFFTRLQEEVSQTVSEVKAARGKRKKSSGLVAGHLKL